jgi:hypothetical protein
VSSPDDDDHDPAPTAIGNAAERSMASGELALKREGGEGGEGGTGHSREIPAVWPMLEIGHSRRDLWHWSG